MARGVRQPRRLCRRTLAGRSGKWVHWFCHLPLARTRHVVISGSKGGWGRPFSCVPTQKRKERQRRVWWTPIGLIKKFPYNESQMFYHLKKKKAHWNSIMALLLHTNFPRVRWVYFWLSVWAQLSVSEPYCFCSYKFTFNFGSWNNNSHLTFIQSIRFVYLGNCKNLNYKQWQHTCLRGVFPAFAGSLHLIFHTSWPQARTFTSRLDSGCKFHR